MSRPTPIGSKFRALGVPDRSGVAPVCPTVVELIPWYHGLPNFLNASAGSFTTTQGENLVKDMVFDPTGEYCYMADYDSVAADGGARRYDLSTPWDITTAAYGTGQKVDGSSTLCAAIILSDDGTKLYLAYGTGDKVEQHSLATPWDLSTASAVEATLDISSEDGAPESMRWAPDGLTLWVFGDTNDDIYTYTMDTPWDISTATYVTNYSIGGREGIHFDPNGYEMFAIGSPFVYTYLMDNRFDVASISETSVTPFNHSGIGGSAGNAMWIGDTGRRFFKLIGGNIIHQAVLLGDFA